MSPLGPYRQPMSAPLTPQGAGDQAGQQWHLLGGFKAAAQAQTGRQSWAPAEQRNLLHLA